MLYNLGIEYGKGHEIFLFSKTSIRALGPTQSHIKWVRGHISTGLN
jgi:hypothetical protein